MGKLVFSAVWLPVCCQYVNGWWQWSSNNVQDSGICLRRDEDDKQKEEEKEKLRGRDVK